MFDGFETHHIDVAGARIFCRVAGQGAPVLLLHGYPQTHAMWSHHAEALAQQYRVIIPDLRGYGRSVCHDGDFTFRAMAADQISVMRTLGHDRFHVVSHDRGARTAHRLTLDHSNAVLSLVLMDILPTLDVWATMDEYLAKKYWHWMFLAQPGDMPERLINADPICYLHAALKGLAGELNMFDPDALADYERAALDCDVIAAWCGDYKAGAGIDLEHDRENAGQTCDIACLVLWGRKGVVGHHLDPVEAWRQWFPNVTGHELDAGHFLAEERPEEVLAYVQAHLSASTV